MLELRGDVHLGPNCPTCCRPLSALAARGQLENAEPTTMLSVSTAVLSRETFLPGRFSPRGDTWEGLLASWSSCRSRHADLDGNGSRFPRHAGGRRFRVPPAHQRLRSVWNATDTPEWPRRRQGSGPPARWRRRLRRGVGGLHSAKRRDGGADRQTACWSFSARHGALEPICPTLQSAMLAVYPCWMSSGTQE